jgi:hypothetical protein
MRHSNVRQVALRRVSLETSGSYRCEVTSKHSPGFNSQFEEGKMVVLGKLIMILMGLEVQLTKLKQHHVIVLTMFTVYEDLKMKVKGSEI